jgi:SAM-dependent methyltransferase
MNLEEELRPYRGPLVEGVGGYKVERAIPPALSRRARREDLLRRIRQVWYIRAEGGWKLAADRIGLLDRVRGWLRGSRPQTDAESRDYWEARGGEGYEREAFSAAWLEPARRTLGIVADFLRREGAGSVLEVGCGPGRNLELLREGRGPAVWGIDFSLSQLRRARSRGFGVACATAKRLPVRTGAVDAVLFAQVLIHVPPPVAPALEEAVRVARRFVVLLEQSHDDAGPDSAPTETPHCFRHDLVGHMRRLAPGAELLDLGGDPPGIRAFRL